MEALRHGARPRFAFSATRLRAFELALTLAGCAGSGGGGSADVGGGGGQCNDGSWCGNILDRDHDGLISPQEMDDAFNAADTNGDGMVSQSEFEAMGGQWGGGGRGR